MTRTLVALCALTVALGGCTSSKPPPPLLPRPTPEEIAQQNEARVQALKADVKADAERRVALWKPQASKYFECNDHAAKGIALQPGDPLSLATAARGMCGEAEANLRRAMDAAYADLDPGVSRNGIDGARQNALERNAAAIVASRAMNAPPPR